MIRTLASLSLLLAFTTSTAALQVGPSEALYEVTFDATWSPATHPGAYPAGAHFSPLVGGTHSDQVSFWEPGGIASPGMESMAETGATSTLSNEVSAAIASGTAHEVVLGSAANSPGTASATFRVTDEHPLITLVTMIAPSPDWFVGITSQELLVNDVWVDDLVIPLFAYDAGTDSGTNFNSSNQNTNPQEPIAMMTGGPFFGVTPLGTFTFRRLQSSLTYGCGVNPPGSLELTSALPAVGQTYSVDVHDPTGSMGTPARVFLGLSFQPAPGFPCGSPVANWNLGVPGTPGELLLQNIQMVFSGPTFTGNPVTLSFNIPNDPTLAGIEFYNQGVLIGTPKRFGLTNAIAFLIGA